MKIFSGSFGGIALWENPNYVSPAKYRQQVRLSAKHKYVNRVQQKVHAEATKPKDSYSLTPYDDLFKGNPIEKAMELEKMEEEEKENEGNDDQDTQEPGSNEDVNEENEKVQVKKIKKKTKKENGLQKGPKKNKMKVKKAKVTSSKLKKVK